MRSVGSYSTSGREKEGNKERTGWIADEDFSVIFDPFTWKRPVLSVGNYSSASVANSE